MSVLHTHLWCRPPCDVVGGPGPHLLEAVEGARVLELGADDAQERVTDDVVQALVKLGLRKGGIN